MNFEILKGTVDSEPKNQIKINKILDSLRTNFEKYGFRPFDTPHIELLDTLTYKYEETAEIVGEIFKLTDRGERDLGLRYDLTTPLCRFVASKPQLKKPFRRYHIAKVFRDGPLKKGRMREFMQCDCDVVGQKGIEIEAELLDLFYTSYKQISINAVIEINNNKILRGVLLQQGLLEEDLSSIILSIDKLKKIGKEGVLAEIKEKGFYENKVEKAIDILSKKDFKSIQRVAKDELLIQGIKELKDLVDLLEFLNVRYRINFSMSRGLDIYTGNIWEAYDLDEKISSSIGSGGRYDKVIGEYTKNKEDVPAVGISFGLVPILACLESKIEEKEGLTNTLIVPLNQGVVKEAFKIAKKIRKNNTNTEIYYEFSMKKAFKYCDYLGVENVIFVGEKDLESKFVTIKNLETGVEDKLELDFL